MIRLCTGFLDEHCVTWQHNSNERRLLEEKERMREERKKRANQEKLTFKIGYVQKKINTFLKKLPDGERRKFLYQVSFSISFFFTLACSVFLASL